MPCFDKKLEASRDDFKIASTSEQSGGGTAGAGAGDGAGESTQEVDCVVGLYKLNPVNTMA
jgi:hypothetical protein